MNFPLLISLSSWLLIAATVLIHLRIKRAVIERQKAMKRWVVVHVCDTDSLIYYGSAANPDDALNQAVEVLRSLGVDDDAYTLKLCKEAQ